MDVQWRKSEGFLTAGFRQIECWSKVRNEQNHLRPKAGAPDHDVARTTQANGRPGVPYMPRTFPVGNWKITGIIAHPDPKENNGYLYPFFIATDAWQLVEEWSLNEDGSYDKPTGRLVADYGYGLHFSTSVTTWGCIRIARLPDLLALVDILRPELGRAGFVSFQVTE